MEVLDPLGFNPTEDPTHAEKRTKKEILNIIKSYVGLFDVFSEAIQNALDSIDRRGTAEKKKGNTKWQGRLFIEIDLDKNRIAVSDNGTGFERDEFVRFVAPNVSYHKGPELTTRGNKGVGATYLAFGFNGFAVKTRSVSFEYSGELIQGRAWVEDHTSQIERPKLIPDEDDLFEFDDFGTTVTITVGGNHSRPKSLSYFQAKSADQWVGLLRCKTPIGDLQERASKVSCEVRVTHETEVSESAVELSYPYPHLFLDSSLNVSDFVQWQLKVLNKGGDASNIPPKYLRRSGIYKFYDEAELAELVGDHEYFELVSLYKIWAYAAFMHSTDVWDVINDDKMELRKGYRVLKGGLLIANNGMVQGEYITIPLTSNIGYQKQCHVVVHLTNADPDLGRKGFQPEVKELCEEIAKKLVNDLKRHKNKLKPNTQASASDERRKALHVWIREQEDYQKKHPLDLSSKHFFKPKNEISIRSVPQKEQDVVALFNQLLAGGVIRSIELLASSQTKQYDGVFRYRVSTDKKMFQYDAESNPLGVYAENLSAFDSEPRVLEYKHDMDYLVAEFHNEEKNADDIDLIVCWQMGEAWKEDFSCVSYLMGDNISLRKYHGVTHQLTSSSNAKIDVIALKDLVLYLTDPEKAAEDQARFEEEF